MKNTNIPYRLFISHAHNDIPLVTTIVKELENMDLCPLWDKNFVWGHAFSDQIKYCIAHSHAFVPILTSNSAQKGWVAQEIGYAVALNIPVLPICVDVSPSQMISHFHAITLNDPTGDINEIKQKINRHLIESLIQSTCYNYRPLYESAELHEERTIMMVEYASQIIKMNYFGHVRLKGALTSFHIPDNDLSHPYWQKRYKTSNDNVEINYFRCKWLRWERIFLELHAKNEGCSLIISPNTVYKKYSDEAMKVRLITLLEFLEKMKNEKNVFVCIDNETNSKENLTIVGDWFSAVSIKPSSSKGYRQTIFTRHAPTVYSQAELFDRKLEELLIAQQIDKKDSTIMAIEQITNMISKI